jgi:hypothetical protein
MAVLIPVEKLMEHCNPFDINPWSGNYGITVKDIEKAIEKKLFITEPIDEKGSKKKHIGRIAYLVENKSGVPIQIDVGVPGFCNVDWFIQDGNHRFAAAIVSKQKMILAEVSGSLDYAKELFCVDCEEKGE